MATDEDDKFTPTGDPIPLEQLTDYTDNGEVAITRGDVLLAIASADDELKKYLQATQYKSKY